MYSTRFDWVSFLWFVVSMLPVLAVVAFFATALALYLSARSRNMREPGSVSPNQMNARLVMLIVASILFVVTVFIALGIVILMSLAIAYM